MRARYAILRATCVSALLMLSEIISARAESEGSTEASIQQDEILTASAFSATREDAWDSAKTKAWNLCMVRRLYNIKRLSADCTSAGIRWECVGTAACRTSTADTKTYTASSPATCGLKKEYVNGTVKFTDTCTGEWAQQGATQQ